MQKHGQTKQHNLKAWIETPNTRFEAFEVAANALIAFVKEHYPYMPAEDYQGFEHAWQVKIKQHEIRALVREIASINDFEDSEGDLIKNIEDFDASSKHAFPNIPMEIHKQFKDSFYQMLEQAEINIAVRALPEEIGNMYRKIIQMIQDPASSDTDLNERIDEFIGVMENTNFDMPAEWRQKLIDNLDDELHESTVQKEINELNIRLQNIDAEITEMINQINFIPEEVNVKIKELEDFIEVYKIFMRENVPDVMAEKGKQFDDFFSLLIGKVELKKEIKALHMQGEPTDVKEAELRATIDAIRAIKPDTLQYVREGIDEAIAYYDAQIQEGWRA